MRRLKLSPHWPLISILAIIALGLALYAPSLGLMLFSDDAPHMQWLSNQHNSSYWLDSAGFPLYRPATFAAWDALNRLFGSPNALVFHVLSVVLHLANGLLVGELAKRLTGQRRAGALAGLFFVAFPFSYGAVILAAAQFHLWQTFGLLAASLLLLGWLEKPQGGWWKLALAWLLAFWAIFQHENGVLAPVLVGGILIAGQSRAALSAILKEWKRLALALGPVIGLAAAYLILRSTAVESGTGRLQTAALEVKIGQALQALGYPLAALFRWAINPQNGLVLAWISGIGTLGVMGLWVYREQNAAGRAGQPPLHIILLILGLGWTVAAMLPAWAFVPVDYLLGSVRLHYLAAVGIAWAWAAMLSHPLPRRADGWRQWLSEGIGIGLCLAIATPFVQARQTEFRAQDTIYRDVGEIAGQVIADNAGAYTPSLMVLNGPSNVSPPRMTFLIGSEGSVYLPEYVLLESLLWVNGFINQQRPLEVEMRRAADVSPSLAVDVPELDRATLPSYDTVTAVEEFGGEFRAVVVGQHSPARANTAVSLADFGNGVFLENAHLVGAQPAMHLSTDDDRVFVLELDWQVASPPQSPAEVFVHLLCGDEKLAQADGPPLGRVYPFGLWQPGERWRDIRYFVLPASQDEACLRAFIGLYDPATGSRLTTTDRSGQAADGIWVDFEQSPDP